MDCGEYQKDNRWLGNKIVMVMTGGVISEGWIVVNIRKISKDYDGDEGKNCI